MVLLNSTKSKLGSSPPLFELKSVDGTTCSLERFRGVKAVVVMFICNHCPYVKAIEDRMIALQRKYASKNVQLLGICSNDPTEYPDDSASSLFKRWKEKQYGFPYLIDETQEVAQAFDAVCTPDIYLLNQDLKIVYRGRLDDNWQDASKVTKRDLEEAIDALLASQEPDKNQHPSMGCSIKWKKS